MPSDQVLDSKTRLTLCVELAPPVLLTGTILWAGIEWWGPLCFVATVPAAFALRQVFRTYQAERRWKITRWLAAEARWRKSSAVAEIESESHRPLVVDGAVVERVRP
ncbi:hypothetical protein [Amycolatopsis sp. NPDC059657]|uniref:hypothetical protein n=1 Tax=Amycolatopsis sp. NPDC059657 TaxID=3346899 RepID=UPI00366CB185